MKRKIDILMVITMLLISVNSYGQSPISEHERDIEANASIDEKGLKESKKQKKEEEKQLRKEQKNREKEARKANEKIKVDIDNNAEWFNIGGVTLNYYYMNIMDPGWKTAEATLYKHKEKKGSYYVLFNGIKYLAKPYFREYKWHIKAVDGYDYLFNLPNDMEDANDYYHK